MSTCRGAASIGAGLVDTAARLSGVVGPGVDEHAWQRTRAGRHTQFATGVVGFRPGGPEAITFSGRSGW